MSKKKKRAEEEKARELEKTESAEVIDKIEQIKLNTEEFSDDELDGTEERKTKKKEKKADSPVAPDDADDSDNEEKLDEAGEESLGAVSEDKRDALLDKEKLTESPADVSGKKETEALHEDEEDEDDEDEDEDDGIASNGKVFFGVLSIIILLVLLAAGGLGLYFLVLEPVYEKNVGAGDVTYPQLSTNLDAHADERIDVIDRIATLTDATFVPAKRKETTEEITTTEEMTTEEWYDPDYSEWDDSEYYDDSEYEEYDEDSSEYTE